MRRIDSVVMRVLFQDGEEWVNTQINNGSATAYGAELELKVPIKSIWMSAPDATVSANVALNGSRVDRLPGPYNVLASQTPFSANVGADYIVSPRLSLGGNYSYRARMRAQLMAGWMIGTGSWPTLDLYGLWKIDPKTSFRLSVANALHQSRREFSLYEDATQASSRTVDTRTYMKFRLQLEMQL